MTLVNKPLPIEELERLRNIQKEHDTSDCMMLNCAYCTGDKYLNTLNQHKLETYLYDKGVNWTVKNHLHYFDGFVYSTKSGKWRKEGKSKWYCSNGVHQFIEIYYNK